MGWWGEQCCVWSDVTVVSGVGSECGVRHGVFRRRTSCTYTHTLLLYRYDVDSSVQ